MQEGTQTALLPTETPVEQPREGVSAPAPSPKKKPWPKRTNGIYRIGGNEYLSVTEIIGILDKPGLVNWAAREAASLVLADPFKYDTAGRAASAIYGIRDEAADRGSTIHSLIEAIFSGGAVDVEGIPDQFKGYHTAFTSWLKAFSPIPIYAESTVYSPSHGYAGTMDLLCRIPSGEVILCDFKSAKKGIYPEHALQVEAYRNAEFILPTSPDADPISLPAVDRTWIVSLKPTGEFEHREVHGDFEVFLALKKACEWRRRVEKER